MSIFRSDLFAGQVALVTGGGTGIGRGVAEALAAHGAATALLSRNVEHLEPTAAALRSRTGRLCLALAADVRRPEEVDRAVGQVVAQLGRLDMVVNGAAGNFLCPAAALSPNGFGTVLDIDAKGTFNVCRAAFAQWMREHGGRILNLSATLHYGGTPGQLHASAAKAAVDALTRNLAVEWGPFGIRTNAVAPGPIGDTEGTRRLLQGELAQRAPELIPIRRLGSVEDVAQLCLFLLSEAARNINGAVVVTDGGHCLVGAYDRLMGTSV